MTASVTQLAANQNKDLRRNIDSPRASKGKKPKNSFRAKRYDNVEHVWHRKPFAKDKVYFLFGRMKEDKMERVVLKKREQIDAAPNLADDEHLVLNDMRSPFRSTLLFSVNDDAEDFPPDMKIEYLSGVWLSKVYRGSYHHFLNWIDDAELYVKKHYGKTVDPHQNWFVYYPSALDCQKQDNEGVLVFFIKVSDD